MPVRISITTLLSLAVFAGSVIGSANGMVLRIDSHGHFTLAVPQLLHAESHSRGADHEPHDYGGNLEHDDLHDLIGNCSDSLLALQKAGKSAGAGASDHSQVVLDLALPHFVSCLDSALGNPLGRCAFDRRGGIARTDLLTCLRSVVLLV